MEFEPIDLDFTEHQYIHPLWHKKWVHILIRVLSTLLIIAGLLCLLAVPAIGVVIALMGVLFLWFSIKIERKLK